MKYRMAGDAYFWFLFMAVVFFCLHVSYNYPVSDAFYFIKIIVIPYVDNDLTWKNLFLIRGESDHLSLLYKLFMILNYHLFQINFRIELVFGLLGFLGCLLVITREFKSSISNTSGLLYFVLFCIFITKLISFNGTEQYTWTLVIFDCCMTFFGLILLSQVNRIVIDHAGPGYLLILTPLTLLFGSSVGQLCIIIAAVTLAINVIVCKDYRSARICLLFLLIASITYGSIFWMQTSLGSTWPQEYSLFSAGAIKFILHGFSQSLLSADRFPESFYKLNNIIGVSFPVILGLVVLCLNVLAIRMYIRKQFYRVTLFPAFLMTLSYFFIMGTLYSRFPYFGPKYAFQGRYVRFFEFNAIAVLWIFLLSASLPDIAIRTKKYILVGGLVLSLMQLSFIPEAYRSGPWIIRYTKQEEADIRRIADGELHSSESPRLKNQYHYKEVIDFLKAHKLSLFSGEF